jgi:hypothetical protein
MLRTLAVALLAAGVAAAPAIAKAPATTSLYKSVVLKAPVVKAGKPSSFNHRRFVRHMGRKFVRVAGANIHRGHLGKFAAKVHGVKTPTAKIVKGKALKGKIVKARVLKGKIVKARVFKGKVVKARVLKGKVVKARVLKGKVVNVNKAMVKHGKLARHFGRKLAAHHIRHGKMQRGAAVRAKLPAKHIKHVSAKPVTPTRAN